VLGVFFYYMLCCGRGLDYKNLGLFYELGVIWVVVFFTGV